MKKRSKIGAPLAAALIAGLTLSLAGPADAAVLNFGGTVICSQRNVNDGAPFEVEVDIDVTLPDEILVGDEVNAVADVTIVLPDEIAQTLEDENLSFISFDVDASVVVTSPEPESEASTLIASGAAGPIERPDPVGPMSTEVTFGVTPYTPNVAGVYAIELQGDFAAISNLVAFNADTEDGPGRREPLDNITCAAQEGGINTEAQAFEVIDPETTTTTTASTTTTGGESTTTTTDTGETTTTGGEGTSTTDTTVPQTNTSVAGTGVDNTTGTGGGSNGGQRPASGSLPRTGSDTTPMVLAGAGALLGGLVLVAASRRRHLTH